MQFPFYSVLCVDRLCAGAGAAGACGAGGGSFVRSFGWLFVCLLAWLFVCVLVCLCVSMPVSKAFTHCKLIQNHSNSFKGRGHGGRSPSRANKAMVFGWKRYWTQYLVPAFFNSSH